jgi:insulysin
MQSEPGLHFIFWWGAYLTIIRVFAALVRDYLTPHLYDATLAGLSYTITTSYDGFSVCVSGYNEKLPHLLERIMQAVHDLEIRQDRFDIIIDEVCKFSNTRAFMWLTR